MSGEFVTINDRMEPQSLEAIRVDAMEKLAKIPLSMINEICGDLGAVLQLGAVPTGVRLRAMDDLDLWRLAAIAANALTAESVRRCQSIQEQRGER